MRVAFRCLLLIKGRIGERVRTAQWRGILTAVLRPRLHLLAFAQASVALAGCPMERGEMSAIGGVQDIFVSDVKEYQHGFRGPGKLDGSFVTWVNGAFLRAVGARAGYDVHFAPFRYRKGSKTQILYTTPRD